MGPVLRLSFRQSRPARHQGQIVQIQFPCVLKEPGAQGLPVGGIGKGSAMQKLFHISAC